MGIKGTIIPLDDVWSSSQGRDYARIEGELYSVNAITCDRDGGTNRRGAFALVMDVRWPVVVQQDGELRFYGDERDKEALLHYGFALPDSSRIIRAC